MRGLLMLLAACGTDGTSDPNTEPPSEACIERAPNAFRTRFVGTSFAFFEGRSVQVVTSIGLADASGITCRAATRTQVVDGGFLASVENRRDDAVYPLLGAYVDIDEDGACSAEVDLVWTTLAIAPPADREDTVMLVLEQFARHPDAEGCARLRRPSSSP